MKKGISVWAFPGDWNLDRIFQTAKEAGFDGVEVALSETGEVSLTSSEQDLEQVKQLAKKHNIQLYSVASGLYWDYSLTSDSVETREKAKGIVRKQLWTAKQLGCDTILVVPGHVGIDFLPNNEIINYETAYNRSLEAINEVKGYAEELKVYIGLENVWNKFLISPMEMRDFIDKINSDFVGAYFDVGNVIPSGYPDHWIDILGSRIKKVHFKDFRRDVGTINGFVDILSGDVDYPQVIKALKRIGYDGFVTAETGIYGFYPAQGVKNTARAMEAIMQEEDF